ncbi:MAG: methyltransferase domain-containing protein [Pseudonocardiaceae bacterium]
MAVMLDRLDTHPDHRVLEVGTGTGYNTALLCHRVGEGNVCSVDIHPGLIEAAREHLGEIGCHPRLSSGDGAQGWAEHAPFDRILAIAHTGDALAEAQLAPERTAPGRSSNAGHAGCGTPSSTPSQRSRHWTAPPTTGSASPPWTIPTPSTSGWTTPTGRTASPTRAMRSDQSCRRARTVRGGRDAPRPCNRTPPPPGRGPTSP